MKIKHGLAKKNIFIGFCCSILLALAGLYPVYAAPQASNE